MFIVYTKDLVNKDDTVQEFQSDYLDVPCGARLMAGQATAASLMFLPPGTCNA